ncbi:HD domain-containing protein [Acholeplasma laidlawii]|uniref:HD domain-containing protein n=1 Tax=Acholeplasma laidlawii TaxID=2148 RepID=UPI0018C28BB2|nr:HD domain-containing protein [Acholeplasma laidlawii]MBG0763024.1 HD domain-containing protein [Acholeplasma laidlawii]
MMLQNIDPLLIEYCERNIIPKYKLLDLAHQPNHVFDVIEKSLIIAKDYDVNIQMIYVVAVFHDIGLLVNRKTHHIDGGKILKDDAFIQNYFTTDEIVIMKQAVEDHRASNDDAPRTIYGKIISEADRLIDPDQIILRTIQFRLSGSNSEDFDAIYEGVKAHLIDKYGHGGYLKLWLKTEQNETQLSKLRAIIDDEDELYKKAKHIFNTIRK